MNVCGFKMSICLSEGWLDGWSVAYLGQDYFLWKNVLLDYVN